MLNFWIIKSPHSRDFSRADTTAYKAHKNIVYDFYLRILCEDFFVLLRKIFSQKNEPFAYKLRNELAKRNVKISDSLDLERVADEVCQYVLKK